MMTFIHYGLLIALAIALLFAAARDIRSRTIHNWLNAGIALAAPAFWWASGLSLWPDVAMQLGIAVLAFALFAGLFALRMMGGGDVKLLTALALWIEPGTFLQLLIIMALAGGALTIVMGGYHFLRREKERLAIPYGVAMMLLLGYKGPELYLSNKAQKRTTEIRKGLPDALDLLVICAEAGLTVGAAFNRVAKELGRAYPELGDEFALTAIELSFLNERKMAFDNLAYRVDLEAVKGVVTTMVQTERYGTPLASALRVLSAEFRNERMMRAEEKAARLPAIMTVPLILFILPVLFIVILGPAACSIADAFSGGIG